MTSTLINDINKELQSFYNWNWYPPNYSVLDQQYQVPFVSESNFEKLESIIDSYLKDKPYSRDYYQAYYEQGCSYEDITKRKNGRKDSARIYIEHIIEQISKGWIENHLHDFKNTARKYLEATIDSTILNRPVECLNLNEDSLTSLKRSGEKTLKEVLLFSELDYKKVNIYGNKIYIAARMELIKEGCRLDLLAKDKHPEVRFQVAKTGYVTVSLLHDPDQRIRRVLAMQGLGLDVLVNDPSERLRADIARHGYCLEKLINDPSKIVRAAVAEAGFGLERLINDESSSVRAAVAKQGYGLETLVYDSRSNVRHAVAKNGYGFDILYRDKSDDVSGYVTTKLQDMGLTINEWVEQYPEKRVKDYSAYKTTDTADKSKTIGMLTNFSGDIPFLTITEMREKLGLSNHVAHILEAAKIYSLRELLEVTGKDIEENRFLKNLGIVSLNEIYELVKAIDAGQFNSRLKQIDEAYGYDSYTPMKPEQLLNFIMKSPGNSKNRKKGLDDQIQAASATRQPSGWGVKPGRARQDGR